MNITLGPETQKLLEDRMKGGEFASPEEAIRVALEAWDGGILENLDAETLASINRAEAEAARGEESDADEAFAQLRRKHFGG